jgi:hypothetical protein
MQDREKKPVDYLSLAWGSIAEFFYTEAYFLNNIELLCLDLDEAYEKSPSKETISKMRDYLKIYYDLIGNESAGNLLMFNALAANRFDFTINEERQQAIKHIQDIFSNDIKLAIRKILYILNDRISNHTPELIHYYAMQSKIEQLNNSIITATKAESDMNLPETSKDNSGSNNLMPKQNERLSFSNLVILVVQRYPRYVMIFSGLLENFEQHLASLSSKRGLTSKKLLSNKLKSVLEDLTTLNSRLDSINNKGALLGIHNYLSKYDNKEKDDYRRRLNNFIELINYFNNARKIDLNDKKSLNKIKLIIQESIKLFSSGFSLRTTYANLLRDLLVEFEKDPGLFQDKLDLYLRVHPDMISELSPRNELQNQSFFTLIHSHNYVLQGLFEHFNKKNNVVDHKNEYENFTFLIKMIDERCNASLIRQFIKRTLADMKTDTSTSTYKEHLQALYKYIKKHHNKSTNKLSHQLSRIRTNPNYRHIFLDLDVPLHDDGIEKIPNLGSDVKKRL